MDPATSELDELQEVMDFFGMNERDALLYLENAIRDFVDIFRFSTDEDHESESVPTMQTTSA